MSILSVYSRCREAEMRTSVAGSDPMSPSFDLSECRTRQRLMEAAVTHLASDGFQPGLLQAVTTETGYSPERVHVFFQQDEDFVMALYLRLATELEAVGANLADGSIADRFHAVVTAKLALLSPYKEAFRALLATSLDSRHELGVLGQQAEIVRERVRGVFAVAVSGATDCPEPPSPSLIRALYTSHLAIVLLWLSDKTPHQAATKAALHSARALVSSAGPAYSHLEKIPGRTRISGLLGALTTQRAAERKATDHIARQILNRLFRHRRLLPSAGECARQPCEACLALHMAKVRRSVMRHEPIHLLLPAFPAKSPSQNKVLGRIPDKAEELALMYLQGICDEIREIYQPGARLTICSDGRVFSDLVGVTDADVTAYASRIRDLLDTLHTPSIDTFNMEDLYETHDFAEMRCQLAKHYAVPPEALRQRVQVQPQACALVNGIERFLQEESTARAESISKTQFRKLCRERAYEVVRRSDAWGQLIAECFPLALRLSIHPQLPHSDKIGILLGDAEDVWMTPWHGVAVETEQGFTVMKRADAEARGAVLRFVHGQPSYFTLTHTDTGYGDSPRSA